MRPALLSALAALAGCGSDESATSARTDGAAGIVGLSTSLPIVWPEAQDVAELLDAQAPEHWALATLRTRGEVRPLDTLAGTDGALPLPADAVLVLAQPWPFSPDENVALDNWVRGGGRVLLFADPMLTRESAYALGDRRRPQDIAMLGAILGRWGLKLVFEAAQEPRERTVRVAGGRMPVNLPGRFELLADGRDCKLKSDGLLADCRIGNGRVIAIADAALLETGGTDPGDSRSAMFSRLLDRLAD